MASYREEDSFNHNPPWIPNSRYSVLQEYIYMYQTSLKILNSGQNFGSENSQEHDKVCVNGNYNWPFLLLTIYTTIPQQQEILSLIAPMILNLLLLPQNNQLFPHSV